MLTLAFSFLRPLAYSGRKQSAEYYKKYRKNTNLVIWYFFFAFLDIDMNIAKSLGFQRLSSLLTSFAVLEYFGLWENQYTYLIKEAMY